jgi:hypothetical protein
MGVLRLWWTVRGSNPMRDRGFQGVARSAPSTPPKLKAPGLPHPGPGAISLVADLLDIRVEVADIVEPEPTAADAAGSDAAGVPLAQPLF